MYILEAGSLFFVLVQQINNDVQLCLDIVGWLLEAGMLQPLIKTNALQQIEKSAGASNDVFVFFFKSETRKI